MVSKWQLGSKAERLYCEKLQKQGFETYRAPKAKFNQQDMFGCDIVALKAGELRFVQVKSCSNRFPSASKGTLDQLGHLRLYLPAECTVFWVGYHHKKKLWREIKIF